MRNYYEVETAFSPTLTSFANNPIYRGHYNPDDRDTASSETKKDPFRNEFPWYQKIGR
ncbi:unnamed protein product [Trichobilharzia regenti]|nr:unnamed protein product [Trichobilharzia regenti]